MFVRQIGLVSLMLLLGGCGALLSVGDYEPSRSLVDREDATPSTPPANDSMASLPQLDAEPNRDASTNPLADAQSVDGAPQTPGPPQCGKASEGFPRFCAFVSSQEYGASLNAPAAAFDQPRRADTTCDALALAAGLSGMNARYRA